MRKTIFVLSAVMLTIFLSYPVFAQGVGTIRLDPHGSYYGEPTMLDSPATFNVYVTAGGDPTCDPHLLLVMTEDTYLGLTGPVTVNWTDPGPDLTIASWNLETDNGNHVPSGVNIHIGATYTVASLKDHLATEGPIYWSFNSILDGNPLTQVAQDFTINLPSSDPEQRMLVYVLGKNAEYGDTGLIECPGSESEFDNKVPPTQPGFVVPELATVLLAGASFAGLAIYGITKKSKK